MHQFATGDGEFGLMKELALTALREIGVLLDQDRFPIVRNGGVVVPGDGTVSETTGKEKKDVFRSRKRRPSAGSRAGPAGRKRSTGGSRSSGAAAPTVRASLRGRCEAGLGDVRKAYPGTEVWVQDDGMWLLAESALLPGLERRAAFLVYLPDHHKLPIMSWGFWMVPGKLIKWIGPRHTNFPDGSICAFNPKDRTWVPGDDVTNLIDLYSNWAVCHLHLEKFGRWPGPQYAPHAYERRTEIQDEEHCGCENPKGRYKDCCKLSDYQADFVELMLDFMSKHPNCGERIPPKIIVEFIEKRETPPIIYKKSAINRHPADVSKPD